MAEKMSRLRRSVLSGIIAVLWGATHHAAAGQQTPADARFMREMIHHHAQALEMTALVPHRSESRAIELFARRIEIAQKDEIAWMRDWLERRGEEVPSLDRSGKHGDHAPHDAADTSSSLGHEAVDDDPPLMPGMLTEEQMAKLAGSTGAEFDRMFLQFMIHHHEGALTMVRELLSTEGAARETDVFTFVAEIDADQRAEILRMQTVLDTLPGDGSSR